MEGGRGNVISVGYIPGDKVGVLFTYCRRGDKGDSNSGRVICFDGNIVGLTFSGAGEEKVAEIPGSMAILTSINSELRSRKAT